jgi:[acyl-carrier-protein] S-malonyltransferase
MRQAAMDFSLALSNTAFARGRVPVLHNVDARSRSSEESIRVALEQQLWQPVRWTETMEELASRGVSHFAECGPGKVLTGLCRRIVPGADAVSLVDRDTMQDTIRNWG